MAELADTSAWIWSDRDPSLRERFDGALAAGEIATCDPVKLELLYGARNPPEFFVIRARLDVLRQCPVGAREWRRALDVYEVLAHQGGLHHRRVKHPDLASPPPQSRPVCSSSTTTPISRRSER